MSPARRFRAPDRHALARGAAALGCGALAALAHPPFSVLPGLLGYAALVLLADRAPSAGSAFRRAAKSVSAAISFSSGRR